ncbi:hypothetical protein CEXT_109461 [Caerostris extrusa]|uniref:Uncharacterized protein n=1 Tax=Caerostris extrusa TaxID=172846 RepID=A0AAV4WQY4_CAEEX|nr:hypothetical protein CEXT_109461 [Caerostris extrusa]
MSYVCLFIYPTLTKREPGHDSKIQIESLYLPSTGIVHISHLCHQTSLGVTWEGDLLEVTNVPMKSTAGGSAPNGNHPNRYKLPPHPTT